MPLPPLFCLTLPEEPWKQAVAAEHFSTLNLTPTFVHGFHGMLTGLRPTNPFQFNQDGVPEYIHIAQAGCALSHILMLKVAIATNAPEFICCEDDVCLVPEFTSRFESIRQTAPSTLDVIQLEYIPVQYDNHTMPMTELSPGLSACAGYGHCAAMIWWKREAAIQATRLLRPIDSPFDIMLMRKVYPFLNHALATPQLATQRTAYGNWPSSISSQPRRTDNEQSMP